MKNARLKFLRLPLPLALAMGCQGVDGGDWPNMISDADTSVTKDSNDAGEQSQSDVEPSSGKPDDGNDDDDSSVDEDNDNDSLTSKQTTSTMETSVHTSDTPDTTTPTTPEDETYKSGSRIRAKYVVGEDGSKQWIGWYDNKLNADCYYAQIGDMHRCISDTTNAYPEVYFANDTCSIRLHIEMTTCLSSSKYLILSKIVDNCVVATELRYRGSEVANDAKIYAKSADSCIETSRVATFSYYHLGDVADPSVFNSATVAIE